MVLPYAWQFFLSMQEVRLSSILIKGGRVIDPKSQLDVECDILVSGSKIAKVGKNLKAARAQQIKAHGKFVCPGFIDLHCHLRDPGRPDKETIESGSTAAVAGGFTTICCMPNTEPPVDNEGIVTYICKEAARVNLCRVYPIAAITKQRAGKEITEFGELIKAGARGFSDDGDVVEDSRVFRHALEYSKTFDVPIFEHPLDSSMVAGAVMNEGIMSTRLGLKGSPALAEEVIVARDLRLAKFTGARLHLCHISTAGALALIRAAKEDGVRVTCETCPHYFYFNEETLATFDTNFKVNPPLRSEQDRMAVIEGLRDGTIDCIATDHAPHCQAEKELEITEAPFGMIGFETALSMIIMELIRRQGFSWLDIIEKMTLAPARILKEPTGVIERGAVADLTIIDPNKKWRLTPNVIHSKSHNSPFLNKTLTGRCVSVLVNGEVKYPTET